MGYPQFDRSRLILRPLAERTHDIDRSILLDPTTVQSSFHHPAIPTLAVRILEARKRGAAVIAFCGAHVLRTGNGPLLIDLMEKGLLTHLALNGAGAIHDFELALIGATCESVARYIRTGEFGLWQETGRINDAAIIAAREQIGFGEALGRMIETERFPYRETSVLAAGYRLRVPVTVHVAIGQDIVHEHPNFDPVAIGQATYTDFLIFTHSVANLEGGVFLNIGSAVAGPEVYLKALSMARNVARQEGREIRDLTTAVFDLVAIGSDWRTEAPKTDPRYYYRPFKTVLVRTVADGGTSFYVQGDHRETVPALYRTLTTFQKELDTLDTTVEWRSQFERRGASRMKQVERFAGFRKDRLEEILSRFKNLRVAVVGDFFLDKYLDVDPRLAETSLETGKLAHQVVRVRHSPGAAGTIVCNLAALGIGTIYCVGLIGDDGEGYELRRDLVNLGCHIEHLHVCPDAMTPTYLKPRDITDPSLAGEHSRYDFKNRSQTPPELRQKIANSLSTLLPQVDAVIVLDQVEEADCGVVTKDLRELIAELAPCHPGVIFWADSRRRIREFRHIHLKCNQLELLGKALDPSQAAPDWGILIPAMEEFRKVNNAPIVVTLGKDGMLVSDPVPTWIPGVRVSGPTDPTGAGDSATAGAVASLASGATLPEAALVGNLVASITVQQLATTGTARPEELPSRLKMWLVQQAQT